MVPIVRKFPGLGGVGEHIDDLTLSAAIVRPPAEVSPSLALPRLSAGETRHGYS